MTMTTDRPAAGNFAAARRAMIDSQLRTSGVNEPWVLSAMMAVPREQFVPEAARAAAYIDRAISLDGGKQLAAPLVHGQMLAAAEPVAADRVLLVGDGQGYLAALLRQLAGQVDSITPAQLAAGKAAGVYSLVVIDGAIGQIPATLASLVDEDGRIVTGLAERGVTRLAMGRVAGGQVVLTPLADIGMPIVAELAAPKQWQF
jgi:protein-L-isoaspartate(D-aspartate) O-methyltransferase